MKHLLPTAVELALAATRLSSSLQRRVKAWAGSVSSCGERFFSEELLLSASVLFLPVLFMTAAFSLFSNIGLGRWVFPAGLLLWGIAVVALHREERCQRLAATLLLLLVAFALAAWALSFVLDDGYDSRTYQAKAVLALLKGVNPYWQSADWVTYTYPAAYWLLSSSLAVWTQIFGASFAFTVVAALAAFLCARRFLATLPTLSRVRRNLLAALLAANPIVFWGFFAHYSDGLLAATLLSVFMLMLCFVSEQGSHKEDKRRMRRMALFIATLLVLLINIKFTGPVYGGILGLTALAYGIRRGASRKTLLRLAGLGSAAAILGVALFGFYPYMTNVRQHANPFHPMYPAIVFGEKVSQQRQKISLMESADPILSKKSNYERWWISLFSTTAKAWNSPTPLAPFSSRLSGSFLNGFGSLFSGSLLLCLTLAFFVRHRGAWVAMAGVMASILFTEASVSFRLAPQNWWLPMLFLVFLLAPDKKQPPLSRAQKAIVFFVVASMLYISIARLNSHSSYAISKSRIVRQVEQQGGWFMTPDTRLKKSDTRVFFNYYDSGLSGVHLPTMPECPEGAETRKPVYGLMLCKP